MAHVMCHTSSITSSCSRQDAQMLDPWPGGADIFKFFRLTTLTVSGMKTPQTWGVSKNRGKTPKMDGENNGKPLFFDGWFGGKTHYFRKHPYDKLIVLEPRKELSPNHPFSGPMLNWGKKLPKVPHLEQQSWVNKLQIEVLNFSTKKIHG